MTDEASLHRAICDHPEDDARRLALADRLDQRGDPRGEFIRVQCELEKARWAGGSRPDLERRQSALLDRHYHEWAGPLAAVSPRFRRGFIEAIAVGPATLAVLEADLER
jgi:uncharacterized protein (TIGR02996 family)